MNPQLLQMLGNLAVKDQPTSSNSNASLNRSNQNEKQREPIKILTPLQAATESSKRESEEEAESTTTLATDASKSKHQKQQQDKTKYPYTTSFVKDGRRIFHTTYKAGEEMVEEFDLHTSKLLTRKSRRPTALGGEGTWEFEIGGDATSGSVKPFNPMNDMIAPSNAAPIIVRNDTESEYQWRIRNCFYEKSVYNVDVDAAAYEIVISTSNKKYYKRLPLQDLRRLKLPVNKFDLDWTLNNNTLIISYDKPDEVKQLEISKKKELEVMKRQKKPEEGDVQCPTQ